ncbi:MAG: Multidrug resistance efflux pump-like protein [candidate division NC10 bacterium]|nr:Multidrug resistance efflux pump-like protein [candidate division NC10 bacterium]
MKKLIKWVLLLAVLAAAGWYAYGYVRKLPEKKQQAIPVAPVRQGDVVIRAYTRGELRALRSEPLVAPNLNGTVQITRLAPLGAFARDKDLIVEFDDSEVLSRIEETELGLESTAESIKKSEAELAIRANQDQVDLLSNQFAVQRAELQVKRNPLLGAIDQKKNTLSLDEAKQRLAQFQNDMQARRDQADASLALMRQQRQRSAIELSRDQLRLRQTKLLASMTGLVSIRQNSFGGSRQMGAQVPDIREGDQVQPGMPVADVLDLSEMELVAKVGELDRANLVEGQEALIQLDALAGKIVHGKIKSLSATASANVMAGDPSKKFDVLFSINMQELLKVVGATPEQIREVMVTAEKNRSRPAAGSASAFAMMGGGPGDNGAPPMFGMQQPGGQAGGRGGFDPSQMAALMASRGGAGGTDAARAGGGRGGRGAVAGADPAQAGGGRGRRSADQGGGQQPAVGGRGGNGQDFGGRGGGGRGDGGQGFAGRGGNSGPTDAEMANAKLPLPPEEAAGAQILLRPGLLADVEIVVEKIPNAINIPAQAVFEKEGRNVVFVQSRKGFEERAVKLLRQSESTMVISEGLKAGEVVALSDPTAGTGSKNQGKKSGGGAGPMDVGTTAPKS